MKYGIVKKMLEDLGCTDDSDVTIDVLAEEDPSVFEANKRTDGSFELIPKDDE
jgi:hypothetical protein